MYANVVPYYQYFNTYNLVWIPTCTVHLVSVAIRSIDKSSVYNYTVIHHKSPVCQTMTTFPGSLKPWADGCHSPLHLCLAHVCSVGPHHTKSLFRTEPIGQPNLGWHQVRETGLLTTKSKKGVQWAGAVTYSYLSLVQCLFPFFLLYLEINNSTKQVDLFILQKIKSTLIQCYLFWTAF